MNINIRKLELKDQLVFQSLISDLLNIDFIKTTKEFKDFMNQLHTENSEIYVVEEENTQVIGCGRILIQPRYLDPSAMIDDIIIQKDYRGNSYGGELVKFLLNVAKQAGCYKVILNCTDDLVSFYEKQGLKREGVKMCKRY